MVVEVQPPTLFSLVSGSMTYGRSISLLFAPILLTHTKMAQIHAIPVLQVLSSLEALVNCALLEAMHLLSTKRNVHYALLVPTTLVLELPPLFSVILVLMVHTMTNLDNPLVLLAKYLLDAQLALLRSKKKFQANKSNTLFIYQRISSDILKMH